MYVLKPTLGYYLAYYTCASEGNLLFKIDVEGRIMCRESDLVSKSTYGLIFRYGSTTILTQGGLYQRMKKSVFFTNINYL